MYEEMVAGGALTSTMLGQVHMSPCQEPGKSELVKLEGVESCLKISS